MTPVPDALSPPGPPRGERRIAEVYPETTVLFSDLVGFTPWARETDPARVVGFLDELFTRFDGLAAEGVQLCVVARRKDLLEALAREIAGAGGPAPMILEADVMLDEVMEGQGYHGATLADKLKLVEPSDFLTIESAWEAHRVRNEIAHAGGDFLLSEREAKRVVELYRQVFDEFRYI